MTSARMASVMHRVAAPASILAGSAGLYKWAQSELGEDAIERTLSFYRVAMPALAEYKLFEWRCAQQMFPLTPAEQDAGFEALHEKWAPRFRDKYLELRGFYLKQGQGIANNVADLFPAKWQQEMRPTMDRVPHHSYAAVRSIVEHELGWVFDDFEESPIGAASIGQVHRATWRGKQVVVKVQYPEVERTFRGDVFAVKRICKELFPQYYVAFEEIEKQFKTEFDYRGEAKNAEEIRANLRKAGFRVDVPRVHLATRKVLVMDEMPGRPLIRALESEARRQADKSNLTLDEFIAKEQARDDEAVAQGRLLHGWRWVPTALNPSRIVDELLRVHGHQVLIDGCFNADPHPGNILVDPRGRLALIDYGQVKRIDLDTRLELARMLLLVDYAVKTDPRTTKKPATPAHLAARKAVAQAMIDGGFATKHPDDVDSIYELASVYYGRDDRLWIYPLNFQQWTDHMQRRNPVVNIDDCEDAVFIVRCAMLIRGLGHAVRQHRNLAAAWRPIAANLLRRHGRLRGVEAEIAAFERDAS